MSDRIWTMCNAQSCFSPSEPLNISITLNLKQVSMPSVTERTVYKLSSSVIPCDWIHKESKFVSGLQLQRQKEVATGHIDKLAKHNDIFGFRPSFPEYIRQILLLKTPHLHFAMVTQ